MSDNSLEPFNVYGGPAQIIRLDFHRDRCAYDMNEFIGASFSIRDDAYGSYFNRNSTQGDITSWHFTISDLLEAFCGTHSPEELADYLQGHLSDETLLSEALLQRIRTVRKHFKLTLVDDSFHWASPRKEGFSMWALNYDIAELKFLTSKYKIARPRVEFTNLKWCDVPETADCIVAIPHVGERAYSMYHKIRRLLDPEYILIDLRNHWRIDSFSDIHIISSFGLPTEGLRVVKE